MKPTRPQNKGQPTCRYGQFSGGRQALGLGLPQIDGQNQRHGAMRMGAQDADAARLDPAANRIGRIGHQPIALGAQHDPVIGHQHRAIGHHFKGQRRFACPRRAKDQQSAPVMGVPQTAANRGCPAISLLAFVAKS